MMHSILGPMPLSIKQERSTSEECVLDLRVPEKRKVKTMDYTLTYPSPNTSPIYGSFPENYSIPPATIYTGTSNNPNVTLISHASSAPHEGRVTIPSGCESPNSTVSSSDSMPNSGLSPSTTSKANRPFKTLTKEPFIGIKTAMYLLHEDVDYATFREKMLSQTRIDYNSTNMNMRRKTLHNENNTDPGYWEKRKKNNEAAKKSRDARKAREDEIAIRCAFLEQENLKLKLKIAAVQSDTDKLQNIAYRL